MHIRTPKKSRLPPPRVTAEEAQDEAYKNPFAPPDEATATPRPRSLFGEILDWMLAPLLLLWPMSIAVTYLVAKSIASGPFDRSLETDVYVLARQIQPVNGVATLALPDSAREFLRTDDVDTIYYQIIGPRGELIAGSRELPLPNEEDKPQPGVVKFRNETLRGTPIRIAYTSAEIPRLADQPYALVQVAETLGKRSRLANDIIKGVILPQFVILPLAIVLVWQAACVSGFVSPRVLPAPSDVALAGWKLLRSGELERNIWVSFWRASTGFVIGGGIGFAFGLANGLSQLSSRLTDTTLQMVRNIPHLALIPLVILWFGIDESAKLFLVALGVFFPIYLNTLHGIRTVDPQLIEMGRIYGMSDRELFRRVIFPSALPSIFVGIRFALGIMWLTLIVAETIAASSGLGYMAMQAREFMLIDVVVLSILIYALLGKLADSASRALERLTLSWHPAFQK